MENQKIGWKSSDRYIKPFQSVAVCHWLILLPSQKDWFPCVYAVLGWVAQKSCHRDHEYLQSRWTSPIIHFNWLDKDIGNYRTPKARRNYRNFFFLSFFFFFFLTRRIDAYKSGYVSQKWYILEMEPISFFLMGRGQCISLLSKTMIKAVRSSRLSPGWHTACCQNLLWRKNSKPFLDCCNFT